MKKTNKLLTVAALSAVIPMAIQGQILAINGNEEAQKDGVAPELRILENQSVGENGVYSKLVLETTDADGDLAYYLRNGRFVSTIPEANNYKNSRTFKIDGQIIEGENTIVVYDKAGNCSNAITYIADEKAPEVKSANLYANVPADVTTYYVNEGKTIIANIKTDEELGSNPIFTFHNNGKDYTVESVARGIESHGYYEYSASLETTELADGEITFTVSQIVDKAGNKVADVTKVTNENKVIVDKTAPQRVYSTIRVKQGITEIVRNGEIYYYVKNGNSFEFAISFNEELIGNPTAIIGNKEIELKLNEKVKNEESKYLYEGTLEIPQNETKLPEGILEITVKNIIDLAGNEATRTIETNQTPTSNHRSVIYDRTAPKITVKENTQNEIFTIKNKNGETYSKISFKLYDAQKIEKIIINGQEKILTPDQYGDHNYVEIGKNYGIEGKNVITLYDIAGNQTTYEFYLENEKEEPKKDDETKNPEEDDKNEKPSEGNHDKHHCKSICCYIKHQLCKIEKIIISIFEKRI